MADLFWLSDAQWAVIEPFMPRNQPGARRVDDRRTISGIVHVIKSGCRWRDCPADYGPHTTVYNRFNRWSRRGFWRAMLAALADAGWVAQTAALDSTYVKAHRSAHGGKGGRRRRPSVHREAARLRRSTSSPTWSPGGDPPHAGERHRHQDRTRTPGPAPWALAMARG
jgi:transposase